MRFILTLAILLVTPALAGDHIAGPVIAKVLKVRDGDTLIVLAKIWPGHEVKAKVRIRGIDAPELKARCPRERAKALAAKNLLKKLVSNRMIKLRAISQGKYYGRVLADVSGKDGTNLEPILLESGLVRPYTGRKRGSWCKVG